MAHDFKQLRVWNEAVRLTEDVYWLTNRFPKSEAYGITSQLRRASVSISSNIAEGCGRNTPADFKRFLVQALGSAKEVESQLILARRLTIDEGRIKDELIDQTRKVQAMLHRLIRNTAH